MNTRIAPDRLSNHSHRLTTLLSLLLIVVFALRRRYDLEGSSSLRLFITLIVLFALLFATETFLSRRIKSYPRIYFVLQLMLVQSLGLFQEYQDTWAILFIVLGFQVASRCSRREALVWYGVFALSLIVTLSAEFGLISGLGRALAYGVIATLVISYDIQYSRNEDSLAESQMLVTELQEANQRLAEHAVQAEKLAALQERNRMIQELYDSVGQKIFAIQLSAETTRMMLVKDPQRAMDQINDLQEQTQSTLGQMRQLIDQWHPS